MARGSSGSGWGIAILIFVGMLASVPKEVWVAIGVIAGIVAVLYFFLRTDNKSPAPAPPTAPQVNATFSSRPHSPPDADASASLDAGATYSESEKLTAKQRAETILLAFNDSLGLANQSKDRGAREYKLQLARERLIELKRLANRYPFLHLANLPAVEASLIAVEAETRSLSYSPGYAIPREIDTSVTSDKCWVGPNKEVDVKELGSLGGMLYYGQGLPSVAGSDVEPALINPKLRVVFPQNASVDRMPYWPSYSRISEAARGEYLTWLAGGRKAPNVQLGCVFLFFYGLERRIFADRQYPEVPQESPAILAEVRRLLTIYGSNGSFYSYANHFLDFIVALGAKDRIYKLPTPPQGPYRLMTLRHKMALGQAAVDGALLPGRWAYSWVMNDERFWPRTPATRCPNEFQKLFLELYKDDFGDGLKLPVNKTLLKPLYQAASSSFGGRRLELTGAGSNIPDVTVLEGPFNKLKSIAERAAETLQPYSRYIGKFPDRKDSGEAVALLPTPLWPVDTAQALTSWLVHLGVENSPQMATFGELVQHLPAGLPLKKEAVAALTTSLEQVGVGMEPDIRWGGPIPAADTKTVFYSLTKDEVAAKPSPLYSATRLTLQLATTVAAADGTVSPDEQQHLEDSIERWLHLSAAEITRLRAHLKWLVASPPPLAAMKRQITALKDDQKHALAAFLISTAQLSGDVSPAEVKVLTKIYRQFGFDEKVLFSQLHVAATEPVTVQSVGPVAGGFQVPPKPPTHKAGAFVLDAERIAALTVDSKRVSEILTTIFAEGEPTKEPAAAPEPEEASAANFIAGMDATFSDFVRVLISRDAWTRAELQDLASDRGVMLDGAMDRINEAFLNTKDAALLEGEDPIEVNRDIARELQAA